MMPTKGQFSNENNAKILSSRDGQNKGKSQHDQILQVPKDRLKVGNRNVDGKFEDRVKVVKNDKFRRQREPWNTDMKGSKPWPGRKATTVDELVKHMSNVPSYLQSKGTADHLQDKALNVGVLEWGLLANWSQQQNHEPSRSHRVSPSNTSRSTLFSSPSHSAASPSSRSVESNQSTPTSDHQHSSSKGQQSRLAGEHHQKDRYSPSPNSAVLSLLPGHGKYLPAKDSCNRGGPSPSIVSLSADPVATSSGSCVQHERDENKEARRKIEDTVQHCSRRLFTGSDSVGKNSFMADNNDYMCNNPEQSSGLNGEHLEPLICSALMDTVRNGSRSPFGFLGDIEPSHEFPQVPFSCPLPIIDSADELGTSDTVARDNIVGTSGTISKNCNKNRSAMRVTEDRPQSFGKFSDGGRMPDRHIVSGKNCVSRSSSLKEVPFARQYEVATSMDKTGDRSSSNSKGNRSRSPLRRMLDPILKPKQTSTSSPIRPSFVPKCHHPGNTSKQSPDFEGPVSQTVQRKSVDMVINSHYQAEANMNQTPHVLLNSARYLQQEKDPTTTRQALLQLAWKNGLPLLMLSYGDSDILAATVRKRDISDKDELECTYAIFTVEEPKKKSGTWIKTGVKNKKHQLLSSIVGEMTVSRVKSRCNCTKNVHVHREFVLVGSELIPVSEESGHSHVNRELAAFISAVPQQEVETSHQSSSQISQKSLSPSGCCCPPLGSFQTNVKNSCTHSANVIAILPNGFHGTSTSGQALPLIERWKSGGACDCGGWDEGCTLSVLTNGIQEEKGAVQANQTLDGSQRFDFLAQGRSREDRHAFTMVSFKEGLYTMEFRSSIALLQAFAMCIVMLHGRYPSRMQVGSQALEDHDLLAHHELKTATSSQDRVPTSYVPKRPPLSPVGRA